MTDLPEAGEALHPTQVASRAADPLQVPQEGKAENEQEQLLLLEPQELLQGVVQLTQLGDLLCSIPWLSPENPTNSHLVVIGLDAYLWSHKPSFQKS